MIIRTPAIFARRSISTRAPYRTPKPLPGAPLPISTSPSSSSSTSSPLTTPTHYRVTLHRSAIGLPERISRTLAALGIHKRMQTVYHLHSPDIAGKLLKVKELVQVTNVSADQVRTPAQAKAERKAVRGYEVVQRKNSTGYLTFAQAARGSKVPKRATAKPIAPTEI